FIIIPTESMTFAFFFPAEIASAFINIHVPPRIGSKKYVTHRVWNIISQLTSVEINLLRMSVQSIKQGTKLNQIIRMGFNLKRVLPRFFLPPRLIPQVQVNVIHSQIPMVNVSFMTND